MAAVNLYLKPETVAALERLTEHYALPSKSATVAFLVAQEERRIGKGEKRREGK